MKSVKITVCESSFSSVALQECVFMTYRKWGHTGCTLCPEILKHYNFVLSPKSNLTACFLYFGDSCETWAWMAEFCLLHSTGHLEVWAPKDEGKHWYTDFFFNISLHTNNSQIFPCALEIYSHLKTPKYLFLVSFSHSVVEMGFLILTTNEI